MGQGIVVIEKELSGESWSNSYAFTTGAPGVLAGGDIESLTAAGTFTADNTVPGSFGTEAPAAEEFLYRLLAFERGIHHASVRFTRMYISDGLQNASPTDVGPLASVFAVFPLIFNGLRKPNFQQQEIAPANVALRATRAPAGFSQRAGRVWYRGSLLEAEIRFAGRGGLDWTDGSLQQGYVSDFDAALAGSGLPAYFGDGVAGGILGGATYTGIPVRLKGTQLPPMDAGDLVAVAKMDALVPVKPSARQVFKGRKRKATS